MTKCNNLKGLSESVEAAVVAYPILFQLLFSITIKRIVVCLGVLRTKSHLTAFTVGKMLLYFETIESLQ